MVPSRWERVGSHRAADDVVRGADVRHPVAQRLAMVKEQTKMRLFVSHVEWISMEIVDNYCIS